MYKVQREVEIKEEDSYMENTHKDVDSRVTTTVPIILLFGVICIGLRVGLFTLPNYIISPSIWFLP